MIYKPFQDLNLSMLGMGCMRLPTVDNDNSHIDEEAVFAMVDEAMARGVNYYDTAWGYHNGQSEIVMGKALARYPRESFYLATKFPGYDLSNMDKVEEIFEKQLEKLGVEYFDFYLFHNVYELNINDYLDPGHGIYDYLIKQKQNGRIRHLGMSVHGSLEVLDRFLAAYGKDIEFCQVQLNWLDWDFQSAKAKVERLKEWNIPVWVMEPLRGGKLCTIAPEYEQQLKALRPDESVTGWAFRWLQSVEGVTVVLSGMSNMEQLKQNLTTFETDEPLNAEENKTLLSIAKAMTSVTSLPCTACRYCTTHCPQGLNIPWLLELYNEHVFSGGGFLAPNALRSVPEDKRPAACIGCRSCEAVCPQLIKISDALADFVTRLPK